MTGPIKIADILERNRAKVAPGVSPAVVEAVATIEERNQFDDDRVAVRRELREVLKNETQALLRGEETGRDS